jgi:hypothetical protein
VILSHRRLLCVLAWLLALVVVGCVARAAWTRYDLPERRDGTRGHTTIDFGGSWLMGRMLVEGKGQRLYEREAAREVLSESYPVADQAPGGWRGRSDVTNLLGWLMRGGVRDGRAIAGPLYPPVNAVVNAPLALLRPRWAYRVHQGVDLGLLVLAALGVVVLPVASAGRTNPASLTLPLVVILLALFPGFQAGLTLGQNSVMSLVIVVWGWVLMSRGQDDWGGAAWGLLAYKPVWAASFLLVLVLSRRWRAALAMAAVGVAQILLTLPLVGLHSWLDWLRIGRSASARYALDHHWILLSRDLAGIPRRFLLDFTLPILRRGNPTAGLVALALWLGVLAVTVGVTLRRREEVRAADGPHAAFLLLGGYLLCYHFMYYDALLAALPVALLFTGPGPLRDRRVPLLALGALLAFENPLRALLGVGDSGQPWSTYVLLALWAWCGWRTMAGTSPGARGSSPGP